MPTCPLCTTDHPIVRHHMTGAEIPDNCIKALAAGLAALGGKPVAPVAPVDLTPLQTAVDSLGSAVSTLTGRVDKLEADQLLDIQVDPPPAPPAVSDPTPAPVEPATP